MDYGWIGARGIPRIDRARKGGERLCVIRNELLATSKTEGF